MTTPPKRKAGRPKGSTKTKLTEETWADKLVSLYENGKSDVEVCAALKLSYNEFEKRCKNDLAFAQLVDYGRLAAKAWWLDLGHKAAMGANKAQFNFWYAVMKNRYGWTDRVENVSEGEKPINQMSQDEIIQAIASKRKELDKILRTSKVEDVSDRATN